MTTKQKQITASVAKDKKKLASLTGNKRLSFIISIIKKKSHYSSEAAEELINDNLVLIESTRSKESALLLGQKAFYRFLRNSVPEADAYADKALVLSRAMKSDEAEAKALTIKGYVNDVLGQHKKVIAWYAMALEKAIDTQRTGILLDMATSLSKQGEYDRSLEYFNAALKHSEKLLVGRALCEEDKLNQIRIQSEIFSRRAALSESIGDFDAAKNSYDRAIETAKNNKFVWELYKALSRKIKFFIMTGNFSEAEHCLNEAQALPLSGHDARAAFSILNDTARVYRALGKYGKALSKYKDILYPDSIDSSQMISHLDLVIKYSTDMFLEILNGIQECLVAEKVIRKAELLAVATRQFEEAVKGHGIYKEIDKQSLIEMQKYNILTILHGIFPQDPNVIVYKNVVAIYNPETEQANVQINNEKLTMVKSSFLLFKYFVKNKENCVSVNQVAEYWREHDIDYHADDTGSRVRNAIKDILKKKLRLKEYLIKCDRPHGWKLLP